MRNKGQVIGYRRPLYRLQNHQGGLSSIFTNGENNLYPYYVKNCVDGSATGSMAHDRHTQYIAGVIKNDDDELMKLCRSAASDISIQNGFFIHTDVGIDLEKREVTRHNPSILPYENCRINKPDDAGNYSRIYVSENFYKKSAFMHKVDQYDWHYRYNNEYKKVLAQIEDWQKRKEIANIEDAIKSFPGQVRFVKFTDEFPYPVSQLKAVLMDMESEYFISLYTNGQTVNGFVGKTVFFMLDDNYENDQDAKEQMEELESWLGTDGASGFYVKIVKNMDEIKSMMHVEQIKPQFDDKLFQVTEDRLRRNILGAFDNLPEVLVSVGDGALFGTNPELFDNAKRFYDENTRAKRDFLHRMVQDTLGIKYDYRGITE